MTETVKTMRQPNSNAQHSSNSFGKARVLLGFLATIGCAETRPSLAPVSSIDYTVSKLCGNDKGSSQLLSRNFLKVGEIIEAPGGYKVRVVRINENYSEYFPLGSVDVKLYDKNDRLVETTCTRGPAGSGVGEGVTRFPRIGFSVVVDNIFSGEESWAQISIVGCPISSD